VDVIDKMLDSLARERYEELNAEFGLTEEEVAVMAEKVLEAVWLNHLKDGNG